ncbi:GAF and ANTAR domain-containing protein [Amycolatopsis carbonis]|uniref:GAF and ANTAR domain-containing protein n=1 Tax=Amycolatopsis carbonis TaxID=715471 RepID=A0A9Y2IP39_9PSEU|nr:GAF and ANTAR domain-containing protein [Amycolatopsis sp. 2-15]WIX82816.1 GAF and ANTAR domain-containing protein [Amycolatopsis sp. 2-15]
MDDHSDPAARPLADREQRLARAFVALADTLAADFDVVDFLGMLTGQVVDLVDVAAAGVVLRGAHDRLEVVATSSHRAELLELFAVQSGAGPCVDCVRSGEPVSSPDLQASARRWPRFAAAARDCGFRSAHALPMRLREQVLGGLTLLGTEPRGIGADDLALAQALADVATIGILQQRTIEHGDQLSAQLRTALDSRVLIEQAKGMLAEHGRVSMAEAFGHLRGYARAHQRRLTELSAEVVDGRADLGLVLRRPPA